MKQGEKRLSDKMKSARQWLTDTQRDSWRLEMLFSGIALLLFFRGYQYTGRWMADWLASVTALHYIGSSITFFLIFLTTAFYFLIISQLINLCLRGLWVAAIGLRPDNGKLDYASLRLQKRFSAFLSRRFANYDDYVRKLDEHARRTFAFSLLSFCVVVSMGISFLFLFALISSLAIGLGSLAEALLDHKTLAILLLSGAVVLLLYLLLGVLIYLIDFLSGSVLKRVGWLQKIYYPIYRLLGWVTLARLYRNLYYAIIHERRQRRAFLLYLTSLFFLSILTDIKVSPAPHLVDENNDKYYSYAHHYVDQTNYDEVRSENDERNKLSSPSIGQRYVSENYLEVFIPYGQPNSFSEQIVDPFDSLAPTYPSPVYFLSPQVNEAAAPDSLYAAEVSRYRLYLNDSLVVLPEWRYYKHPHRKQLGLVHHLPVRELPYGRHIVRTDALVSVGWQDSISWITIARIPFYK